MSSTKHWKLVSELYWFNVWRNIEDAQYYLTYYNADLGFHRNKSLKTNFFRENHNIEKIFLTRIITTDLNGIGDILENHDGIDQRNIIMMKNTNGKVFKELLHMPLQDTIVRLRLEVI